MDIRTILYINIFLLAGCAAGLSVIAFLHKHFRQLFWLTIAYGIGCASTVLRMLQGIVPDFFTLVFSNMLLLAALLIIHHHFAVFVKAHIRSEWLEILLVAAAFVGLVYYTHIDPSFEARSLLMSGVSISVAILSFSVLVGYADAAVRIPCLATASLYAVFIVMTVMRCVGILFWHLPNNFFVFSTSQFIGLLGFYILIAGIPVGYFWMASTRLYANQELLAKTDPLTGLLNRRGLEDQAQREIERSRRHGTSLAVLAIDLDHFKRINDQHGHEVGDAALCSVAKTLTAAMRAEDAAARPGGEEFIALLANTGKENAKAIAERLRSMLESMHIDANRNQLRLTASFGIAVFSSGDTFHSMLRRADQALYAAKLAGRNCVMLETENESQSPEQVAKMEGGRATLVVSRVPGTL
ncbi:MAG TPA: GGDEF domain-containing protein [Terriglobales bacterium]|nr:GGDEF domain-containing protein [Terriglobales bacterium]